MASCFEECMVRCKRQKCEDEETIQVVEKVAMQLRGWQSLRHMREYSWEATKRTVHFEHEMTFLLCM